MSFAVYASSRGNYFWREPRRLLARALGGVERDERRGWARGARWHVVVAPQEFFTLGRGRALQRGPWPSVVLYDAEQPGSRCAAAVDALRPRARASWALDRTRARALRCPYVPLGWVEDADYFPSSRPAARPLDVVFVGGASPRRRTFFAEPLGPRRSVVELVDDEALLPAPRTRTWLSRARRAKIVLNVHREERPYMEWHRIGLHGLGQGALVLSEPVGDAWPLKAGRDFAVAALPQMREALRYYLQSAAGRAEARRIAERGFRSFRAACRLETFLKSAAQRLKGPERVAEGLARRRLETAAALYGDCA